MLVTPFNPHANVVAVCCIELKILPIEVLHCVNRDFGLFLFLCLNLDPMTFIYELDSYPLEVYQMCEKLKMNFLHQGFRKLSHYSPHMPAFSYA